jgi:hypothetical protein
MLRRMTKFQPTQDSLRFLGLKRALVAHSHGSVAQHSPTQPCKPLRLAAVAEKEHIFIPD